MIAKVLMGAMLGGLIGGVVGYIGKSAGGACPLTCNPIGGILVGLLMGAILASSNVNKRAPLKLSKNYVEIENEQHLERLLATEEVVLVDMYADWCGPCRRLKPILQELADEFAGRATIAGVNIENHKTIAEQHGVSSIPHVKIFSRKGPPQDFVGLRSKETYQDVLNELIGSK